MLPLEILQVIVNYLPFEKYKDCIISHSIYKFLKSYKDWSYLILPYGVAKGMFSISTITAKEDLANVFTSKKNQPKYFSDHCDPIFRRTLNSIYDKVHFLELLQQECTFQINHQTCFDLFSRYQFDHLEPNGLLWWLCNGFRGTFNNREIIMRMFNGPSDLLTTYLNFHMKADQAINIAIYCPQFTHQVWHVLRNLLNSVQFVLYLQHENADQINKIVRHYTIRTWYEFVLKLNILNKDFIIESNTAAVIHYLLENKEELDTNEWRDIHECFLSTMYADKVALYLSYMTGMWERHIESLISVELEFLYHYALQSRKINILYHVLPQVIKSERKIHLTRDHLKLIEIYLDNVIEINYNVVLYVASMILTEINEKLLNIEDCFGFAKIICHRIVHGGVRHELLYQLLHTCLSKKAHQIKHHVQKNDEKNEAAALICPPILKTQADSSQGMKAKWDLIIKELLPIFNTHLRPHLCIHKTMSFCFGKDWTHYWPFSEKDELFRLLSDDDLIYLEKRELIRYWQFFEI